MPAPVVGIDIAKQKAEVALLDNGKIKRKSIKNAPDGFEALTLWLRKQSMEKVPACLEAGHRVSVVNPARIKGFAQNELIRTKTDRIDAGVIARLCLAMEPAP
jgi:transposase